MTPTPLRELVEQDLTDKGHTLADVVVAKRKDGEPWQNIAYWVDDMTGRRVTAETLRRWFHTIT